MAQGPVDLAEQHVRQVGAERAPAGELERAAADPVTDAGAVIQVEQHGRQVERQVERPVAGERGGLMSITPLMPGPVVSRLAGAKS